jgi:hypothetical protein
MNKTLKRNNAVTFIFRTGFYGLSYIFSVYIFAYAMFRLIFTV